MFIVLKQKYLIRCTQRKELALFAVTLFTLLVTACGPKEKGNVTVTASVYNRSGFTLLVTGSSAIVADTLQNEAVFSFVHEESFKSKSKPLCCPCAGKVSDFTFTVTDTSKKLSKNLNDATLWEKQTKVKIDYWICKIVIEPSDIVNK